MNPAALPLFEITFVYDTVHTITLAELSSVGCPLPIPRAGDTVSVHGKLVTVGAVSIDYDHTDDGRPWVYAHVTVKATASEEQS